MSTIVQSARPFFANEKRQRALAAEAQSWLGTPFHAHASLKAVGVDCVQLAAKIYIATGFIDEFNPGWYPIDGGHHDEASRVIAWIEKSGKFARAGGSGSYIDPRVGDLICIRFARVPHHVGVMISDKEFVHAYYKHMVMVSRIDDKEYAKRIEAIYRPICSVAPAPLQNLRD